MRQQQAEPPGRPLPAARARTGGGEARTTGANTAAAAAQRFGDRHQIRSRKCPTRGGAGAYARRLRERRAALQSPRPCCPRTARGRRPRPSSWPVGYSFRRDCEADTAATQRDRSRGVITLSGIPAAHHCRAPPLSHLMVSSSGFGAQERPGWQHSFSGYPSRTDGAHHGTAHRTPTDFATRQLTNHQVLMVCTTSQGAASRRPPAADGEPSKTALAAVSDAVGDLQRRGGHRPEEVRTVSSVGITRSAG